MNDEYKNIPNDSNEDEINQIDNIGDIEMLTLPTEDVQDIETPKTVETSSPDPSQRPIPGGLEPPDGGYGWVVAITSCFLQFLVLGNVYSFGVYYPVYIDAFNSNRGNISWVGSISSFLMVSLGIFVSPLADYLGNNVLVFFGSLVISLGFFLGSFSQEVWHLYVTVGFIVGIGNSLTFVPGIGVVGQWFTEKRGFALGISIAGAGIGQFVLSLLTKYWISEYGWRISLRYLALINLVGLMLCSLFLKRFYPTRNHYRVAANWIYLKDRNFCILCLAATFNILGLFLPYAQITLYSENHGVSGYYAVWILSIMGLASSLGRVSLGYLADKIGKIFMLKVCMLVSAVSTFAWLACKNFDSILAYALIFGYFAGGSPSLIPAACGQIFGSKKLTSVLGLIYTFTSIGNLLSVPIGGFLFDAYGSYYPPIIMVGCLMSASLVTLCFLGSDKSLEHVSLPNEDVSEKIPTVQVENSPSLPENDHSIHQHAY